MKMITAIVNKKDVNEVSVALTDAGFEFTRMASSGGFLRSGNTTLLIGTDDDKVEAALELIRKNCSKRTEVVPSVIASPIPTAFSYMTEVTVGGAIVFVTDVVRFEKM
ncbi:MAG: cyclic-di-AMP receptor [Clostridia bacterium]|nr:cyclic-di-AMP receptor [Clostridia bacterium]